jgi:hypothetical protein
MSPTWVYAYLLLSSGLFGVWLVLFAVTSDLRREMLGVSVRTKRTLAWLALVTAAVLIVAAGACLFDAGDVDLCASVVATSLAMGSTFVFAVWGSASPGRPLSYRFVPLDRPVPPPKS